MENFCRLCGTPLEDGACPNGHSFKKMCINCSYCSENENGDLVCKNEENLKTTYDKIMSAVSGVTESYEVKNLEIAPLPLKKPTLKCGKWALSEEVLKALPTLFK